MNLLKRTLVTLFTGLGVVAGASATPILIDFEDVAVATGTTVSPGIMFESGGFRFSTSLAGTAFESSGLALSNDYSVGPPPSDLYPHSGSTYLGGLSFARVGVFGVSYLNTVTMESVDGLSFSLNSLDAAETFIEVTGGLLRNITFEGTTVSGNEISTMIELDGVLDGAGPGEDFESLSFGADWSNLASLSIYSRDFFNFWHIDNIRLNTGEPISGTVASSGTFSLLILGLMLLRRKIPAH
jgi:hypothetical protein